MSFDLDKYYTPVEIILPILDDNFSKNNFNCVDTTCGRGSLLLAAEQIFGDIQCVGIDQDKSAILNLKRKNPDWQLSVADMLNPNSYKKSKAVKSNSLSDLLLLNPPFSHQGKKAIPVYFSGLRFKASVAMTHILNSLTQFRPKNGAMIIVPESVLFSDTDSVARAIIEKSFTISIISELDCKTFTGAVVRSTVIKLIPGRTIYPPKITRAKNNIVVCDSIVRGGLPVHHARATSTSELVPFIHSTNLRNLDSFSVSSSTKTSVKRKGRVSGNLIFLPRVGLPINKKISSLNIENEVQLSDCVIAIKFRTKSSANKAAKIISTNIQGLISLYRGTGARYITVKKLETWLHLHGIHIIE